VRHPVVMLLLCGCAGGARPGPVDPPGGAAPSAVLVADCRGYCEAVGRCEPEHEFGDCAGDCVRLLSDVEASEVSGFTRAHVRCWSAAPTCALAATCDAPAAEGEGK
jgi:hypothetical protein